MKKLILFSFLLCVISSCTKEKQYQYDVNTVTVNTGTGDKPNQKSTTEFISIAYADLFNTTIPQSKLINLSVAYSSFGDLKVIEDRIIRNLLNTPGVSIPSAISVNGDTSQFVVNCYRKFYNRDPNELEKFYWKKLIATNTNVNPMVVYYSMMTSDEYRFY
jgi:hypothetical protein